MIEADCSFDNSYISLEPMNFILAIYSFIHKCNKYDRGIAILKLVRYTSFEFSGTKDRK